MRAGDKFPEELRMRDILNEDKTEILLAIAPKFKNHPSLPSSIGIDGTSILFSPLVCSLGVILDQALTFKQDISNNSKTAYFKL